MTANEWKKIAEEMLSAPRYNFQELQMNLYHTCKDHGYTVKEIQAFTSKCIDLATVMDENENRELLDKISKKLWFSLLNSIDVNELLDSPTKLTPKQKSLVSLYFYLNMIESASTVQVQFIALMLIKNGHKLRFDKNRFAETYKDLERMNLKSKLDFLIENDLGLAVRHIDRNLRNCIAHQEFVIYDDGTVRNLMTGELIDIQEKVASLCFANSVNLMVTKQVLDVISPSTDRSLNR
jgi:hypothetical protein